MKVAIAGYGVEGRASYAYFGRNPENEITIFDEHSSVEDLPHDVKAVLGKDAFDGLKDYDLIIRTASLSPHNIITNGKKWSATEEFFQHCPALIIGVTGTKGKGTTASMIASILKSAGKKVWLIGNIGTPSLSVLPEICKEDIVVYELSSFQLWSMNVSPSVAVLLNIEAEHLDVHDGYDDYVNAKANIRKFQSDSDFCVYYGANPLVAEIAALSHAPSLSYGLDEGSDAYIKDNTFYVRNQAICSTRELFLRGTHNLENAVAAVAVAHTLGVASDLIAAGLRSFIGLPHRLEYVNHVDGVAYYNDSFSSSPSATIAAIEAFNEPEVVIIGGVDRGADFTHLARKLVDRTNVKEVVLVGEISQKFAQIMREAGVGTKITVLNTRSMQQIVRYVHQQAKVGDVVVLSPGAASFDMFKDFYDRGDQFRREVQGLANKDRVFVFESYSYDNKTGRAVFQYCFEKTGDETVRFTESVSFSAGVEYDEALLDNALRLAFLVAGTSYYKAYPTKKVRLPFTIDEQQAVFLNKVYQEGLSQFIFENDLKREDLVHFEATGRSSMTAVPSKVEGVIALQSGGKDSLLTAMLLADRGGDYTPWYLGSAKHYPKILDDLERPLLFSLRQIDTEKLQAEHSKGARNGHVPVTYIVQSYALIQAILQNKNKVLVSIAHEGEEPHAAIGDLSITHQWSKTWTAEILYSQFVEKYVSPDIFVGSPLRQYSELRVAELFVQYAWGKYGDRFSSCNRANYRQAADNSELRWCGDCPKCANSYLLFAPFVEREKLKRLFNNVDLFTQPSLRLTFKGLLGVDDVMKPFECVGEVDELRYAYHLAVNEGGYSALPFPVSDSSFDYKMEYPAQDTPI